MSKWCIDPNEEIVPDSTYDENNAQDDPLGPGNESSNEAAALYEGPQSEYNPPGQSLMQKYSLFCFIFLKQSLLKADFTKEVQMIDQEL